MRCYRHLCLVDEPEEHMDAASETGEMTSFYCESGSVRRVAVIGAGVSGLVAIKSCLEEDLEPVCFERSSFIGGLWAPHKTNHGEEAFVYDQLVFNSSKEMSCFSDFPYPKSYPPYISPEQHYEYLKSYADRFSLLEHVRFDTTVVRVSPKNQRWRLNVRKSIAPGSWRGEVTEEVFDAVMICNGLNAAARQPNYPGREKFLGRTIHSCRFRKGSDHQDENVLVVGGGDSAGDVAVECSRFAQKVYLSTWNGAVPLPRFVGGGIPLDAYSNTFVGSFLPDIARAQAVTDLASSRYKLKDAGLAPTRVSPKAAPMINDEIVGRIMYGAIETRPSIKEFKSGRVFFRDGSSDPVDTVIFATGYASEFPFIDDSILPDKLGKRDLYLHVFPVAIDRPTLAVIGTVSIVGASGPICEMHARCAAAVFKGAARLPSKKIMEKRIAEARVKSRERDGSEKPKVTVVQTAYEMGRLAGFYPNIWKRIFRGDIKLARSLLIGPFYPYVTRLEGRHPWSGARQAIIDGMDNMFSATRSPPSELKITTKVNWKAVLVLLLIVFLVLLLVLSFK